MGLDSDLSLMLFVGVASAIVATRSAVADAPCPGTPPREGFMNPEFMSVFESSRNASYANVRTSLRCTLSALS